MPEPLGPALARLRPLLLDPDVLVRAVLSGRRRGQEPPADRRAEVRWVDLRGGPHLQVVRQGDTQARTTNHAAGEDADAAAAALADEPWGSWHVETTTATHQLRVTKKGQAQVHVQATVNPSATAPAPDRAHDRTKARLLPEDDPVLRVLGLADDRGRVKPGRRAKYRQVEELLRLLGPVVDDALDRGHLRRPTPADPLRLADLGCGNGYLTLAAQRWLGGLRGLPVAVTGVDAKQQAREHGEAALEDLRGLLGGPTAFVAGRIDDVDLDPPPEVVLALHACDTATDDALARAVAWRAPVVLAAPCCHHDVAAQLRRSATPSPYASLTRDGILRERFADTLTDALRASLLRLEGYRVDVVEFVGGEHTPRNTLLRAVRTGADATAEDPAAGAARDEYDDLVATWGVRPALADRLGLAPAGAAR